MTAVAAFIESYAQLLKHVADLESSNSDFHAQLNLQRTLAKEELLKHSEAERALEKQIATLTRQKRRAEVKHAQQLQKQRARAAEFRAKMCEYRRDLVALRTIVRHQERT